MSEGGALRAGWARLRSEARRVFPGVAVCLTIAAAARFLADNYGAPHMLFALLLGMAFHFLSEDKVCRPGIDAATKYVLRAGVALLGTRITVDAVLSLGLGAVVLVGAGVLLTIVGGVLISRLAGYPVTFGLLTGGAVGICGASAALAIAAVIPRERNSEQNTVFAVIAVTTLSTIAMIVYPIIARSLDLDTLSAGLFLGGTIHDVAQVVGAGYSLSADIGDTSTVTKLFRVAMLVPVVFVLSLALGRKPGHVRQLPVPFFVLAFCALVAVNSAGWIPFGVAQLAETASGWFLVAAIAGLGIKTSLKQLAQVGPLPVAVMVIESLFLACWVLGGAVWLL
jgi:uncharacterized integral membrane protein (TIGR00698 family)